MAGGVQGCPPVELVEFVVSFVALGALDEPSTCFGVVKFVDTETVVACSVDDCIELVSVVDLLSFSVSLSKI
jgi:hypothetical protein